MFVNIVTLIGIILSIEIMTYIFSLFKDIRNSNIILYLIQLFQMYNFVKLTNNNVKHFDQLNDVNHRPNANFLY